MRKIYILPNLFTAASLFAGMLAIFAVFDGQPVRACWLILLSALLDVADGAIARLTRTQSAFGLNLDSLADLVAFGVAPGLLVFHAFGAESPGVAMTVASLFVVCGALRLARFNVQASRESRTAFHGMPIPAAALAVVSLVWVLETTDALAASAPLHNIVPIIMVVLSYLMVSKMPYIGFRSVNLHGRQPFELLVSIVTIGILLFLLQQHLNVVLLVGAYAYAASGPIIRLVRHRRRRRDERLAQPHITEP